MSELLIVDPSTHVAEHEAVREVAEVWGGPTVLWRPALHEVQSPRTADECAGIVILGSRASVVDSFPWLEELGTFLKPILSGRVSRPVLGVCFGHQYLCYLLGGEVGFLTPGQEKKVAVETTRFTSSRWCPEGGEFPVVCSHREIVSDIAGTGLRAIASRPDVQIDAVEHSELPIFGCQFHPEARLEFGQNCGLDLRRKLPQLESAGRELLGGFFRTVVSER